MLLRYKITDYTTYNEDEILLFGTPQEIIEYIMKYYSVDWLMDSLEEKSEKVADLNCLSVGQSKCPSLFDDVVLKDMYENGKDVIDKCDWVDVVASHYIFNREVLEIF